jgi:hypothetical protein
LVAVKAGSEPLPLAARPMVVLLFVHAYVVCAGAVGVKPSAGTAVPVQCTWSAGSLTCADGLTVIVNVCGVPEQLCPPLVKVGVTVIVALIGDVPPLVAVKAAGTAAAGSKTYCGVAVGPCIGGCTTGTVVVKASTGTAVPAQCTWSAGSLTCADGLTVMVNVCGVPGQPSNDGVTVWLQTHR